MVNKQGVKGQAGEEEEITRQFCAKLAHEHLRVDDALPTDFAICHRPREQDNSSISVHLVDLNKRNQWLSSAKNPKGKDTNISIISDLPPVFRPLKRELLDKRKILPLQQKSKAKAIYASDLVFNSPWVKTSHRPGLKQAKAHEDIIFHPWIPLSCQNDMGMGCWEVGGRGLPY